MFEGWVTSAYQNYLWAVAREINQSGADKDGHFWKKSSDLWKKSGFHHLEEHDGESIDVLDVMWWVSLYRKEWRRILFEFLAKEIHYLVENPEEERKKYDGLKNLFYWTIHLFL